MIILSHRGYWKTPSEKNQRAAFARSFEMNMGTETDLRDSAGTIVIAHDMPQGGEMTFEEVLQMMDGRNLPLALNIKADGLSARILQLLQKYQHTNYFTFDMSVPELLVQIRHHLSVFTGLSDVQPHPVQYQESEGVWLDCFKSDWYDSSLIDRLLNDHKKVCIVSADLHQRSSTAQWAQIKKSEHIRSDALMLCTDYPEQAREYFNA